MYPIPVRGFLIDKIEEIVPAPAASVMTKVRHSVKTDEKRRSQVKLAPSYCGISLVELEHKIKDLKDPHKKRYAGGGVGKVKKVYYKNQLIGALKIFTNDNKQRDAINEVRYNQLLGRESIWGEMNNKCYVLSPWIDGMNLHEYCKHLKEHAKNPSYQLPFQLPKMAAYQHLKMMKHYFRQVKIFHDLGLIIKDPKTGNAMVNFAKGTIEILDFDAIHPIGKVVNTHTRMYVPPDLISLTGAEIDSKSTQADDIYILGLMIAELFPHIFKMKFTEKKPTMVISAHNPFVKNDLIPLVHSMIDSDRTKRPNINECIESIKKILAMDPSTPSLVEEDEKDDEFKQLSKKINIKEKEILFKKLCLCHQDFPKDFDQARDIIKIYPEMLNQIIPNHRMEKVTILKYALIHKQEPIISLARSQALKNQDLTTLNLILMHDGFDNLETER